MTHTDRTETLTALVRDFLDPDPCQLDHHGYCQAHSWLCEGRCPHARAREVLAEVDAVSAAVAPPTTTHGLSVPHADALWDAVAIPGPRTPTYPEQHERVCRAVRDILDELTPAPAEPAARTALRDRIADTLTAAAYECDGKCGLSERECYDAHPITFSAMAGGTTHVDGSVTAIADAVLAVLPEPADRAAEPVCICGHPNEQHFEDVCQTCGCGDYLEPQDAAEVIARWRQAALKARADRAAVLTEPERKMLAFALEITQEEIHARSLDLADNDKAALVSLRRMADETATTETGCWCGHPEDRHWTSATAMTFTDGCHDCRGWNGAHVYGQELPWLPEGDGPAAGARQDGAET
jgi:hypothetical protein